MGGIMSNIYYNDLTDNLSVWIAVFEWGDLAYLTGQHATGKHKLSRKSWDFTGRYRYKHGTFGAEMDIEVIYTEWESVPRKPSSWWDGFWNGTFTMVLKTHTMWVNADNFVFKEKMPVYTYECAYKCPTVTYE